MHKKILLCVGITILFLGLAIQPSIATVSVNVLNDNLASIPLKSGKTIYVDDDNTEGPWEGTLEHPYQFIQDGVDNASDGDTVYVFDGIYYERVKIFVSIDLYGENQNSTIIDANSKQSAVRLETNHVTVSGFTLQNSGNVEWSDSGVHLGSMNNRADFCKIIVRRKVCFLTV